MVNNVRSLEGNTERESSMSLNNIRLISMLNKYKPENLFISQLIKTEIQILNKLLRFHCTFVPTLS